MPRTVLAIGAHIGDMDLTAGPLLATHALAGHRTAILALTPGERGHPRMSPEEYREQKIAEGARSRPGSARSSESSTTSPTGSSAPLTNWDCVSPT
jgi:hypothetical protein